MHTWRIYWTDAVAFVNFNLWQRQLLINQGQHLFIGCIVNFIALVKKLHDFQFEGQVETHSFRCHSTHSSNNYSLLVQLEGYIWCYQYDTFLWIPWCLLSFCWLIWTRTGSLAVGQILESFSEKQILPVLQVQIILPVEHRQVHLKVHFCKLLCV